MSHDHHHHEHEDYFLDQISTVAACGLIAGVTFLTWRVGLLMKYNILTEQFNRPVLLGSLGLATAVVIRGISLWREAGVFRKRHHASDGSMHDHRHEHPGHYSEQVGEHRDHGHHHHHHDHESCSHHHGDEHHHEHHHGHGEECTGTHDQPGNDEDSIESIHGHGANHDHGHDHGFAPWRYAVLLMPLTLTGLLIYYYFAGLELTYSWERMGTLLGKAVEIETDGLSEVASKDSEVYTPGLRELADAASDPGKREYWEGRLAELRGLFAPISDREFTLFRLKMTCCASDAVPVKVRIFAPEGIGKFNLERGKGVSVVGQVQFRKAKDRDEYVPIIVTRNVRRVELGNEIFDRGS